MSSQPGHPLLHPTPVQIKQPCSPTRAIRIVNPHPVAPPLPLPRTTTARPRISPGYLYLKDIIEKFDKTTLPAFSGNPHIYPATHTHALPSPSHGKKGQSKPHGEDEHSIIRMDPLLHVLTFVFLPCRCDTSTCLERFQEFYNGITPTEWESMATWKYGIENNVCEMKSITGTLGPDAAVSRAMKRWAERILGMSLETIFAAKMLESYGIYGAAEQQYALGLSASYKENPQVPVYHYPSLQLYAGQSPDHGVYNTGFTHFTHTGNMGNVYNPQRTPHSAFIPMPVPITRTQIPAHLKSAGMLAINPTTTPNATTSGTDSDRESSTQTTTRSKCLKRRQRVNSLNNLHVIPEKPRSTRPRSQTQHSHPIPNPSGRETPPHKRSPKKKKNTLNPEDRSQPETLKYTMSNWIKESKNNVAKLIVNKWADGKQNIPEGKEKKGLYSGEDGLDFVRGDSQLALPAASPASSKTYREGKINDVTKTIVNKRVQGKPQVGTKYQNPTITNDADNPWPTHPQPSAPKMEKNKQKPPSKDPHVNKLSDVERQNYSKAVSHSNGRNGDQKPPTKTMSTFIHQTKDPTRNPAMLARNLPTEPDLQEASKALRTKADYARAASGVNRRNKETKAFIKAPAPPPIHTDPAPIVETPWRTVTNWRNGNLRIAVKGPPHTTVSKDLPTIITSSHATAPTWPNRSHDTVGPHTTDYVPLIKGPLPTSPSQIPACPSSGKSWSSIVMGHTDDGSTIMNQKKQNNAESVEYPELGRSLSTLPLDQLPGTHSLKKKTSLSAQAKIFEPAGPHHTASPNSYTSTAKIPTSSTSLPKPTNTSSSQTPAEVIGTGYDPLLEIFYTTPQFTEYLNKSYDWLLFQQNYLRAQYQRIEIFFENEWNMITPEQRKAVVARAITSLSEKIDKVQFWDISGVEDMLSELGLTTANLKGKGEKGRNTYHGRSYLRTRAEYCFDLDPDAFGMTPYWLFNIIGWLLGTPPPLRHRFGPGLYNRSSTTISDNGTETSPLSPVNFWCPGDCFQCADSERTISKTRYACIDQDFTGGGNQSSDSIPGSPMLERFLDEIDTPAVSYEACTTEKSWKQIPTEWPSDNPKHGHSSYPNHSSDQKPSQHFNIVTEPRLMSNRFQDSIFKPRSPEWTAAHLGRAQFMEIVEIDIALFYCELIEEILHIFGEIRRERVWYTLPTIWDWYDGPTPSSPQTKYKPRRGRPHTRHIGPGNSTKRSKSCPTWGSKEPNQQNRDPKRARREGKLEEVKRIVEVERNRVKEFVRETQRTVDWLGAGLRLVERETDREVERAWDGGLWTAPVPREEKAALEEGFSKWCVLKERGNKTQRL